MSTMSAPVTAKRSSIARAMAETFAASPLPEDASAAERRLKALSLRTVTRKTFPQIAAELDISVDRAKADVKRAMKEVVKIPTDAMVDRQRAILVELVEVNMPAARRLDADATSTVLRCLEHEAKLYGLYAPSRVNVGVSSEEFGAHAAQILCTAGAAATAALRELAGMPRESVAAGQVALSPGIIDAEIEPDMTEPVADTEWSNV